MAELLEADRKLIYSKIMKIESSLRNVIGLSKLEFLAAVNATDTWIEDNQTSYNDALPEAAKNNLTSTQKVLLFMEVALKRWEVI